MSEVDQELVGDWIDEECPQCGATLLSNKRGDKWCSNAGAITESGCQYGLGTLARVVFSGKGKGGQKSTAHSH